jgi:hypothetical protein
VSKQLLETPMLQATNDHAEYWRIGPNLTVTWMPGYKLYLCLTCNRNKCDHTERLRKFREREEQAA